MLRITAGSHRGRKLKVPRVMATRPLTERAREGLMSHLLPILSEAVIWDLYAGSGVLGLEALSRGASKVIAWEWSGKATRQLEENATLLGILDDVQIFCADVFTLPEKFNALAAPDIIFFDPPYAEFLSDSRARSEVWNLFCQLGVRLNPGGCMVIHTPKGELSEEEITMLPNLERRDYGNASLWWWHRPL